MRQKIIQLSIVGLFFLMSCNQGYKSRETKIRPQVDTLGFAQYHWQMDRIIQRINDSTNTSKTWRVAISPHDDYAYVGDLYSKVMNGIKAKTIILFGVAHKARNYELENKIVFDSFDEWKSTYGNVQVSEIRNEIISKLPDSLFIIHDEMQAVEHSLEALLPFLQYQNRDLEIIPILVPYMTFEKMQQIADSFSKVLSELMIEKDLSWGEDVAMIISSDAVHYGDQDWGGKNYAPFGTDSIGLVLANYQEMEIINKCLLGGISKEKIQLFINYTVQEADYKAYKWTWCGRYSVPLGLLTAVSMDVMMEGQGIRGEFVGYSNSIDHHTLEVHDLGMGTTAPANTQHWVGYAAVGYE